jgi:uncharacterized phiE125 gp8 family phage protein
MSELVLITASTATPVSVSEAKEHLYLTDDDQDKTLNGKLKAATEFCQRRISGHRQFSPAVYDLVLDQFPADRIRFPLPPLKSITSVKYYDTTNTTAAVSSTAYHAITPSDDPGYIEPVQGAAWPATRSRPDAVTIRFTAGYAHPGAVPDPIREAILLKTEHLFDPERIDEKQVMRAVDDLLGGFDYGSY